jgi:hypothetical protein
MFHFVEVSTSALPGQTLNDVRADLNARVFERVRQLFFAVRHELDERKRLEKSVEATSI